MPRPCAVMMGAGCSRPQGPPDCSLLAFHRDIFIQSPEEVPVQNYLKQSWMCSSQATFENHVGGNKCKYLQSYSHPHIERYRKVNYKRCKWLGYYTVLTIFTFVVFRSLQMNVCSILSISTKQIIWDVSIMPLLTYSLPSKTDSRDGRSR